MSSENWKIAKFTVGGTIVVALIGETFTLVAANLKTSSSNAAQPPPASPTATDNLSASISTSAAIVNSPISEQTSPEPPPVSAPTIPVVVVPSTQYLTDMDPVGGWGNWMTQGADTMHQITYARSVICKLDDMNATSIPIEFTIPSGAKIFDAFVGLDDNTPSGDKADFQVSLDGNVVSDQTLGVGATYHEHIPLGGAYRLTITMILVNDSAGIGHGVWGNARFTG